MAEAEPATLTDEMALVIAACAPAPDPARLAALALRPIDTEVFLALVQRHRVAGLVQRGFTASGIAPPAHCAEPLADASRTIARRSLPLAAETVRLHRALTAAGVTATVLKGAPLAMLAHGTLAAKMAWDIDLLVPPDQISIAAGVLTVAGYGCTIPDPAQVALADWHAFAKDSTWVNARADIAVELHTALTESPQHLLPKLDAHAPTQSVALSPGLSVPTLAPDALFAYLCVHGAYSGWRRLKWLADLAGLLHATDAATIAHHYRAALEIGSGRAAAQGLALSAELFGTRLPDQAAADIAADWKTRILIRWARRMMTDPAGFDRPEETALGTIPLRIMLLFLVPGLAHKRAELLRRLRPDPRAGGRIPYVLRKLGRRLGGARPH